MTHLRIVLTPRLVRLAILLVAPLLLNQAPLGKKPAPYKELSTRWDVGPVIETNLPHLAAVMVCPVTDAQGGLVAIDSTGELVDYRFNGTSWQEVRRFSIHQPVTAACAGMPEHDRKWRIYVGTRDGHILELSRGELGWTTNDFYEVTGPVRFIMASNPGLFGVSQMFVIDGNGHVTNLWIAGDSKTWIPRDLPDLPGGTVDLTLDYRQDGMRAVAVNEAGVLYKFVQDSLGHWAGDVWATMPAGPLDMAPSADPTMKDVAVFYSGEDGVFRYLFANHRTDEEARVPIADATTHLIGKNDQLRFNEFFGINGGEFCLFEFDFKERRWNRLPQKKLTSPVVSVEIGPARGGHLRQLFVATANGEINEFVRQKLEEHPEDSVDFSPGE